MNASSDFSQNRREVRRPKLFIAIALLAVAGIVVSSVALRHHFGNSKTSFCDFGQEFNCDIVNRSEYSTVAGVPVAVIGIAGYLLILALATIYREKAETPIMLLIASIVGLGFSLYLTYIEKFVLQTWCIVCLSSLALILGESILSAMVSIRRTKHLTNS